MKIISKFSDYYDSGIAYGIDENLRFKRESFEVEDFSMCLLSPSIVTHKIKHKSLRAIFYFKLVGFCGEIYPLIHIVLQEVTHRDKKEVYTDINEQYCYDFETAKSFMKKHMIAIEKVRRYDGYGYSIGFSFRFKERTMEFFEHKYPIAQKIFMQYKTPYFLIEEFSQKKKNGYYGSVFKFTLLPILKDIKFTLVKEPIEAFQEISMYLGVLRTNEDDMVSIDDKHLSQAKGFDCYSFKKLPEKSEKKKCN